jgi:hypothetical protein
MSEKRVHTVTLIAGDGIGPEVSQAVVERSLIQPLLLQATYFTGTNSTPERLLSPKLASTSPGSYMTRSPEIALR